MDDTTENENYVFTFLLYAYTIFVHCCWLAKLNKTKQHKKRVIIIIIYG